MDNKKNYVAGIDFGSSSLVMAVGTLNESTGEINVETLLSRPSSGIEEGVIQNINDVCTAVSSMKQEIEEDLGISIKDAYAGVSGSYIYCYSYSDHVFTGNGEVVMQSDVDALNDRMSRVTVQDDEEVMDRFPLNYVVDHRRETVSPVGAFSRQLSSTFAFIVGKKQPLTRLQMVFENSGLRLAGIFANSAIMANAVLTPEEKTDGVAVVDLGADTTDVAVYSKGILRYAATIPMGGRAIDNDINKHGVSMRDVEDLKKAYGSAVASEISETEYVNINSLSKSTNTIMTRNLASIIEARLTDIIDYVKSEIKDSGYESKLPYGLVLTGGTSLINNIDRLFAAQTEREVRVAVASEGLTEASRKKVDSPEYTAIIALLEAGAARGCCEVLQAEEAPYTAPVTETEKRRRPFEPGSTSTAETYQPPKNKSNGPRMGVIPPRITEPQEKEAGDVVKDGGEGVPEGVSPETTNPGNTGRTEGAENPEQPGKKKPEKPEVERKSEKKQRKNGLFGRFIDSLSDMFQGGEDMSFDDEPASGSRRAESTAVKREPAQRQAVKNKPKFDLDEFYVDGSDSEEI